MLPRRRVPMSGCRLRFDGFPRHWLRLGAAGVEAGLSRLSGQGRAAQVAQADPLCKRAHPHPPSGRSRPKATSCERAICVSIIGAGLVVSGPRTLKSHLFGTGQSMRRGGTMHCCCREGCRFTRRGCGIPLHW